MKFKTTYTFVEEVDVEEMDLHQMQSECQGDAEMVARENLWDIVSVKVEQDD